MLVCRVQTKFILSYVLVLWVLGTGEALAHTIGGFFSSSVWIGQLFFHLQSFWEMFQMTVIVPPPYNSLQESNLKNQFPS